MSRAVPDTGPFDAPLLIVGEAGGKDEGRRGEPFVGAVGRRVRAILRANGVDDKREVRYANVIPIEMPTLPAATGAWQAIVRAHWSEIEPTLMRGEHAAVLAYGRAALWRLTGATRITEQHGAIGTIEVGGRTVPLVASIHPASVMRSKVEAGWTLVEAATARAVRYARGARVDPTIMLPAFEWDDDGTKVRVLHDEAIASGRHVAIDCEFDRDTKRPFIIGVSVDGVSVVSAMVTDATVVALRALLDDARVTKVLHHAPADVVSLATIGVGVRPPIYDTLLMYAACYPDLPVGLARVALHLFDHVYAWKGMEMGAQYNAIDVALTWRAFGVLRETMAVMGVDAVWSHELQHVSALCLAQEARGLAVDPVRQRTEVDARKAEAATITARVKARVDEMFALRRRPYEIELARALDGIIAFEQEYRIACVEHPNYTGLVKPRGKDKGECSCHAMYNMNVHARTCVSELRKTRDRCKTVIKRWTLSGFELGSNDHLRWLLYDADGFKLTPQRDPHTGRPTASADAIARLLALKRVQATPLIRDTLIDVKRYQHLEKMVSTFLLWDDKRARASDAIDKQGFAHPEDRPFGTGTGRHAGGPDATLDDRRVNPYAYSVLNLPEETRAIYVPHPAVFTVDTAGVDVEVVEDDEQDDAA